MPGLLQSPVPSRLCFLGSLLRSGSTLLDSSTFSPRLLLSPNFSKAQATVSTAPHFSLPARCCFPSRMPTFSGLPPAARRSLPPTGCLLSTNSLFSFPSDPEAPTSRSLLVSPSRHFALCPELPAVPSACRSPPALGVRLSSPLPPLSPPSPSPALPLPPSLPPGSLPPSPLVSSCLCCLGGEPCLLSLAQINALATHFLMLHDGKCFEYLRHGRSH